MDILENGGIYLKIKSIFITTVFLSTLMTMLIVEEGSIKAKQSIHEVKVASTLTATLLDKSNNNTELLNNKSLSFEKAVNNGDIIEISGPNWVSNKTHNNTEIYNINKLDDFMNNIINEKKDKIRIVKYEYEDGRTWVNKLYDLEYNGKEIKLIGYDTYSNPNVFIASEPYYNNKITMRDYEDDIWYGNCLVGDKGGDCATLISFKKSSIVK